MVGKEFNIKRWVAGNKGYVPASDEEAQIVSAKITDCELGLFIKRMFNIENSQSHFYRIYYTDV